MFTYDVALFISIIGLSLLKTRRAFAGVVPKLFGLKVAI